MMSRRMMMIAAALGALSQGPSSAGSFMPAGRGKFKDCKPVSPPTTFDAQRIRSAQAKRERRADRNRQNEEAQGRYPETARCRCGDRGEINYDDGHFRGYFCGRNEWCCP